MKNYSSPVEFVDTATAVEVQWKSSVTPAILFLTAYSSIWVHVALLAPSSVHPSLNFGWLIVARINSLCWKYWLKWFSMSSRIQARSGSALVTCNATSRFFSSVNVGRTTPSARCYSPCIMSKLATRTAMSVGTGASTPSSCLTICKCLDQTTWLLPATVKYCSHTADDSGLVPWRAFNSTPDADWGVR